MRMRPTRVSNRVSLSLSDAVFFPYCVRGRRSCCFSVKDGSALELVARRRHLSADVPLRSIGGNLVVFSGGESRPIPSSALDVQELIELSIQRTSRCRLSFPLHLVFEKKKDGRRFAGPQSIRLLVGTWRRQAPTSIPTLQGEPKLSLSLSTQENSVAKLDRHILRNRKHTRVIQNVLIFIFFFFVQMNRPIQVKPADSDNRGGKCGVARLFLSLLTTCGATIYERSLSRAPCHNRNGME